MNPQDADACSACVDAADEAGIPIIGVNTMVNNDKLTAYVGSQDVSAGEDIMKYMIDYMKKDAFNIVVIEDQWDNPHSYREWKVLKMY